MPENKIVLFESSEREAILRSVGLNGDEQLKVAVDAMVSQAYRELPTHPSWYLLGGRNAEGISALRRSTEGEGWVRATSKSGLEGVIHLESGRFIAVHNTCERTGLSKGLPRFASARSRAATKSLRDDLQGDLFEVLEDTVRSQVSRSPDDELTMHLCAFIELAATSIGEQAVNVRAELIIGATCNNLGFTSCKWRIPIDMAGGIGTADSEFEAKDGNDEGAVEAVVAIRKRR